MAIDLPPASNPSTLEVYYASDCLPCRTELPFLATLAEGENPRLVVHVLTDWPKAKAELTAAGPELAARAQPLAPAVKPRKVLADAGDGDGVLPFSRMLDGGGKVCGQWRGVLTPASLKKLFARCGLGVR